MVIQKEHITGYDAFCEFFKTFDSQGKNVHVYFSGSKLPSGESWCDDCQRSWPVVEKVLKKLEEDEKEKDSIFISVDVGDRPTWKDPQSSFRTDKRTKLMVIPTLLRWEKPQRLIGDQCEKEDLVEMLFTDEDD
ncbi:thioredoxin domain-containing protein 17-like [Aethina tumida]|uniref:thioredoxin domain-containing protein 17-like n=1 Tax=Aethina tumida TaxID=116153 RepID=UPI00096B3ED8|nr:thioredoxin domain-containing protein 17-like [Aethina tumida]